MSLALLSKAYSLDSDRESFEDDDGGNGEESGTPPATKQITVVVEKETDHYPLRFGEADAAEHVPKSKATPSKASTIKNLKRRIKRKLVGSWMWSYKKRQLDAGLEKCSKISNMTRKRRNLVLPNKQSEMETYNKEESIVRKVERLKCPFCNEPFTGPDELIRHLETHNKTKVTPQSVSTSPLKKRNLKNAVTPNGSFECRQCDRGFGRRWDLQRHMKVHSETGRPWECAECGCRYLKLGDLRNHESTKHGRKVRECSICNLQFSSESDRDRHLKVHEEGDGDSQRRWKCLQCPSFFLRFSNLRQHEIKVHGKNLRAHQCPSCNQSFSRQASVRRHMRICKTTLQKTPTIMSQLQPCKLVLTRCDHLLPKYSKSALNIKAEGGADGGSRKSFGSCVMAKTETESPSATTISEPEVEIKSVNAPQRIYNCPYCLQPFLEAGLLITHLPIHTTREKASEETLAPKNETETAAVKTASEPTGQSTRAKSAFECTQCSYSCLGETALQIHMRLHSDVGRPFQCTVCKFSFPTFKSLRSHEGRFHKGSKQSHQITPVHKCQHCNYSSRFLPSLMHHLKLHQEEGRPYRCLQCNFTFTTFKSLRTHEGRFHKSVDDEQL